MASFCLVSNCVSVGNPKSYKLYPLRAKSVDRCIYRSQSVLPKYDCASFHPLKSQFYCNLVCCSNIGLISDGNRKNKVAHLESRELIRVSRKFSLRLRPRLRLLSTRLKRVSIRSAFNDFGMFLRKHMKKFTLATSISFALGICYLFVKIMAIPNPKTVPYSDLVLSIQNGSATKVLFEEGSRRIYFNTKPPCVESPCLEEENVLLEGDQNENVVGESVEVADGSTQVKGTLVPVRSLRKKPVVPEWQYATRKVDNDESFLLGLMREKGIVYSSAPQSVLMSFKSILLTVLTLWIPLAPMMWLLYRQLYASNGPAKKRKPSDRTVSFDDVEGVDSAKVELMEIVSCMQGSINYNKLGARLPRGVLLVGPPGTGKTLLARAVAGEAGVPFFSVSASEFVELFVGRGAARIRDLFSVARKSSPSIIFIDELDAVGGKRGRSFNDERDQTLNQLLTEMDGFESDTKVVVIAATNRPEALDQALCRPGRFSRKVVVGEPDEEGRKKILAVHFRDVPLDENKQLICDLVASLTQGLVGADLANIVNESALLAARRGGEAVSREDIMEAIERAKFGINNKQILATSSMIGKELGKLFPWIPSIIGKTETRTDGFQEPMGYQTLSS
ncbi:unnamed protein product [Amaranthus hypochondriacus]